MKIQQTGENRFSASIVTSIIHVPFELVDITDWLLHLRGEAYQRCSNRCIAAGNTSTDDGTPTSINVEIIGTALIIQHYVATSRRPDYCRAFAVVAAIKPGSRTKVLVLWELRVVKKHENTYEYRYEIHGAATENFFSFLKQAGISIEKARELRQAELDATNHDETPLFARSIKKKALTGTYGI